MAHTCFLCISVRVDGGVWQTGFFQSLIKDAGVNIAATEMILGISILLSQHISNVPLVALYQPLLHHAGVGTAELMALAAGSTIAGTMFILGAASNVIIIQNAEKKSKEMITFFEFARVGVPLTLVDTVVYWIFLKFLWDFFSLAVLVYCPMAKRKRSEETLSLFGEEGIPRSTPAPSAYILHNRDRLKRWASKGILFGGSSWKYPGWKGIIYSRDYKSKQAFNEQCLAEYSEVFSTVCADFALYDFPDEKQMKLIHDSTNGTFKVSLKVTDRITIKRYPSLPRFGQLAGTENPNFLDVELFEDAFLKPLEALKQKRGAIIFEFSTFHPNSGITHGKYVDLIDLFLSRLPRGYEYSVELRNSEFLTTEYLTMLTSHGVAHVLNNWTRMPPIIYQIKIAGVLTARFSVARALLKPGRSYQEAVETFQPYDTVKEENPELRMGLVESVHRCIAEGKKLYAYVNNRAEGNSPKTIEGILDILDTYPVEKQ